MLQNETCDSVVHGAIVKKMGDLNKAGSTRVLTVLATVGSGGSNTLERFSVGGNNGRGPDGGDHPAGKYVGRMMDADVDARDADEKN